MGDDYVMGTSKKYILFGAGEIGRNALRFFGKESVVCFCDNAIHSKEDKIDGVSIIPASELPQHISADVEVIITTTKPRNLIEISGQLRDMGVPFSIFEEAGKAILQSDLDEYTRNNHRDSFAYEKKWEYMVSIDRFKNAGTVHSYFWQDLWAAKRIYKKQPSIHYDIGSRLDGFISHLLSYGCTVRMIDIRPLPVVIPGLEFVKANATELDNIQDNSIESLSALCSLEHFGLGRYGDPIDPEACFKAFCAIQKKLAVGGSFYMAVPIGMEHLEFNAHRVFSPKTIINEFSNLELVEFSTCYNDEYEENVPIDKYDAWDKHGGDRFGLFYFVKR